MMGVRFDREYGFHGPRRWEFDVDEFLLHLVYVALLVLLVVAWTRP
jgi:hypothetical protein